MNINSSYSIEKDTEFKILLPYSVYINEKKKEIFYVNRDYKYLGYQSPTIRYIQYPEIEGFILITLYDHSYNGYPLNSKELMNNYRKRLETLKEYTVIFSPEDPYKYNDPILLLDEFLSKF